MKIRHFLSLLMVFMSLPLYTEQQTEILSVNSDQSARCCGNNYPDQRIDNFVGLCCEKGPRGPRGHRGRRGRTGATGATGAEANPLGQLFLNALQMTHSIDEGGPIPIEFFFPYSGPMAIDNAAPVAGYVLNRRDRFVDGIDRVGVNFTIPNDLDITQPVTVVLYLVTRFDAAPIGSQAKILLEADYKSSYELIGIQPPATGFVDSETSPDFLALPSSTSGDILLITTTVSLDPSLMTPGDWAFLQVSRVPAASDEFQDPLYITTLAFQYTRIVT